MRSLPAILVLVWIGTPSLAVTPTFVGMAEAGSEGTNPAVSGVATGGAIATGYFTSGGDSRPMRWTPASGMVHLTDPGVAGYGLAISDDGSVIVGKYQPVSAEVAFRWTGGVMTPLGDLSGGSSWSWAYGISADGSVVVGRSQNDGFGIEAFIWTQSGGMVGLGDLPGGAPYSSALGVSGDGLVVVGESDSGFLEAFRWTQAGGIVGLGDLPGAANRSKAFDASADGSVIVGAGDIDSSIAAEAFRWTQSGGMLGLGDLAGGAFHSRAYAVSADGSVVVGFGTTASAFEAFVWDASNGIQSISDLLTNAFGVDLTDWNLVTALAVSADGRTIAGDGEHLAVVESWVAQVPLPDEYDPVPAGPQISSLVGGTATPGGLQISFDSLTGGTIIAQYLRETQAVLGQGVDLEALENAGFKVPGHKMQAWDITFVGTLNPAGHVVAAFAYDESLLSSSENELAVFHYPETGPMLICSPNSIINTCPELAVIDDVANTITITVDAIPSIEVLAGPPPPMPAMGSPALLSLSILLMACALGALRLRATK